jgi:hypothetical protein
MARNSTAARPGRPALRLRCRSPRAAHSSLARLLELLAAVRAHGQAQAAAEEAALPAREPVRERVDVLGRRGDGRVRRACRARPRAGGSIPGARAGSGGARRRARPGPARRGARGRARAPRAEAAPASRGRPRAGSRSPRTCAASCRRSAGSRARARARRARRPGRARTTSCWRCPSKCASRRRQRLGRHNPKLRQPRHPGRLHLLGQFIDHDITFDPTSTLQRDKLPRRARRLPFASLRPRLDLRLGPGRRAVPVPARHERMRMLIGQNGAGDPDLPRNARVRR